MYSYIKIETKGKIMETVKRSEVAMVGGGEINGWSIEDF